MRPNEMSIRRFSVDLDSSQGVIEAVGVECGEDLVVVVGGGSRYHCGAVALSLSLPSLKDPRKMTNSTYQVPAPGHKEEALAREGSLILSRELRRTVVVSVGIHEDNLPRERIPYLTERFFALIEQVCEAYREEPA